MFGIFVSREKIKDVVERSLIGLPNDLIELRTSDFYSNYRSELALVWRKKEPNSLPDYLVVGGSKIDFLAWVNTYVPSLRPISSYFSLVTIEEFQLVLNRESTAILNRRILGCIGLVIAETQIRSLLSGATRKLEYSDALSSLAMCFTLSILRGCSLEERRLMFRGWRRGERARQRGLLDSDLLERALPSIFDLLFDTDSLSSAGPRDFFQGASFEKTIINEIEFVGHLSPGAIEYIASFAQLNVREILAIAEDTRERRVVALEEALLSLARAHDIDRDKAGFVAGLLVSQASPGSLDYLPLLASTNRQIPDTVLWYGVFAGLHPKSQILDYQRGVGLSLLHYLARARSDIRQANSISLDEYELLLDTNNKTSLDEYINGIEYVELVPGVVTKLPVRNSVAGDGVSSEQRKMFTENTDSVLKDVRIAMDYLKKAQDGLYESRGTLRRKRDEIKKNK